MKLWNLKSDGSFITSFVWEFYVILARNHCWCNNTISAFPSILHLYYYVHGNSIWALVLRMYVLWRMVMRCIGILYDLATSYKVWEYSCMHNQCIVKTTNQMDPEPSQQVALVQFTEVDSPKHYDGKPMYIFTKSSSCVTSSNLKDACTILLQSNIFTL